MSISRNNNNNNNNNNNRRETIDERKNEEKKKEKTLKFQLPLEESSEESFGSALSINEEETEFEELIRPISPVLKKFTATHIRRSCPRAATAKPCFQELSVYEDLETQSLINMVTSSKLLMEISKNSPTHSEADFHLLNSSYLRKLEGVQEAIRNGADVNAYRDRESPLVIASELGDDRLAAYLLTVPDVDVNFRNIFGETPLLIAVKNTFNKIVRMLLNHNADVNITDNMGKSPLHVALFQQRLNMARLLLAYGADYDLWDAFGERPIYTSVVKKPHLECMVLLLNVGASPEYRGFSGLPLISRAIMNWTSFSIIETLVAYGASVNAKDLVSGKRPLHFAAIINDLRITKFLIKEGADPNLKTVFNITPYEEALSHKSIDVAQYLANITSNANFRKLSVVLGSQSLISQQFREPTVINVPSMIYTTKPKKGKKEKREKEREKMEKKEREKIEKRERKEKEKKENKEREKKGKKEGDKKEKKEREKKEKKEKEKKGKYK